MKMIGLQMNCKIIEHNILVAINCSDMNIETYINNNTSHIQGSHTYYYQFTLQKKRIEINFSVQQNASNAIFIEKENPCSFFHFSFRASLNFYFMNALVYVDHGCIYFSKLHFPTCSFQLEH